MSQPWKDCGDRENNLDPDATRREKMRRLGNKAGLSSDRTEQQPSLDTLDDRAEQQPDLDTLDALAETARQSQQKALDAPPDSPERDRAMYQYNRDAEGYFHHATRVTKLAEKGVQGYHKLSTGQIYQAKEEYQAILNLTAIKLCLSDRPGKDEHYLNKVAPRKMIDACRKEAKGKRSGKETLFLEESGDAPIAVGEVEANSIIELAADDRVETDTHNSLTMLDLEQMANEITMRSRPDISLLECFELALDGYSLMDIARHFAPNLPKEEFDRFYTNLRRFIQHEKIFKLLKSYTGTIVIIISILMASCIDF